MADDVRERYDPFASVSKCFWDLIAVAQTEPELFASLTDHELIDFANQMLDLKGYFAAEPFYPPADVLVSENSLDEAGAWVISQGKAFFRSVWQEPQRFWSIMADHEYHQGHDFEFAAERVWKDRHGTDIPTI